MLAGFAAGSAAATVAVGAHAVRMEAGHQPSVAHPAGRGAR